MHARLKYSKQGRVRFIGHRDLARALERALRVAQVPLAFTEGFSPHPKISFGHALTVGAESVAEYLDITTRENIDLDAFQSDLNAALPDGISILEVHEIHQKVNSLQEVVTAFEWKITLTGVPETVTGTPTMIDSSLIETFLERVRSLETLEVERERKGEIKISEARAALLDIRFHEGTELGAIICAEIAINAGVRPNELIAACATATGIRVAVERFCRQEQWIQHDGQRCTPLAREIIGVSPIAQERVA